MITDDYLRDSRFPAELADIFIEMLKITALNYSEVKEVLNFYRNLGEDDRDDLLREITKCIGFHDPELDEE